MGDSELIGIFIIGLNWSGMVRLNQYGIFEDAYPFEEIHLTLGSLQSFLYD